MYATVGFLCIDIGELWGTPNKRELQNKKILLTVGDALSKLRHEATRIVNIYR